VQGYRININPIGHAALRACLDDATFAAYDRTLHRQPDPRVCLYSPDLRLLACRDAPGGPGAIDRGTVRRVLGDAVAADIRFGRPVASAAEITDTDLIVAADGIGSRLRRQLLPDAEPQSLGATAIFGRCPLTDAHRAWAAPAVLRTRFTGVVDVTGARTLALCAYDPPPDVATAPYLMWALIGSAAQLPPAGATPRELLDFAEKATRTWDSRATWVLRDSRVADTFRVPLRAMTRVPEIPAAPDTPVAFLGDAVHAMSPAGGEGANTAFQDAALLVSHLGRGGSMADAVSRYHADMRVAAGEALRRSAGYHYHVENIMETTHV
jgi:2-polyprenyl-6-methoxyphenol hydroxylase-like FAD-dependent oxidoreductase